MADSINTIVKTKTYSNVTTDANASITLHDLTTLNSVIVCINANVSYAAVTLAGVYNNEWIAQARDLSSGNLKKSQGIGNIVVYYIEK